MRRTVALLVFLLSFTTSAFGKDLYLSIGGSVGNFRTDARIFNPSYTKDITVTARYLPAGPPGGDSDNTGVTPKTITVAKRSMAVYDDVVQSLFGGGPALGAVRLTSDDDFVATQRIYADESASAKNGTLGQFVPGLDVSQAIKKGVLIQLKASGARGTKGTFRTNWGMVNPNATTVNVSFTLYNKNNAVAGTNTLTVQPFGVISPTEIAGFFGTTAGDPLSNAWIAFEANQSIFMYASVLDNGSEDPTFIPASEDTGVAPPQPTVKTVNISAQTWFFTLTQSAAISAGDQVRFVIRCDEDRHGFTLFSPTGQILINIPSMNTGQVVEQTITLPTNGSYAFVCAFSSCGAGHSDMTGSVNVGTNANDDDRGGGKY